MVSEKHLRTSQNIGAPDMIRTCDLLIRNQTLYPAELRVHFEGDNYNSTNLLWQEFI